MSAYDLDYAYWARTSILFKPEISNLAKLLINHTLDDR